MRNFWPLPVAALTFAASADSPKLDRLEYATPAGVTYVVTADGLNEVRLGTRVLARGGWRFRVADSRWGFPAGPDAEAITAKSLEVISPTEARVTHTHAHALVRHTFAFSGEDVRIESWVENHDPTASIQVSAFEGPRVAFGRVPRGILPNWHSTYTAYHGPNLMHPGGVRIGGAYGIGDGFGVGAAPHDAGRHPTVVAWDWDWTKRETDPERTPTLYVHDPIPPRAARTFAVTFRFSPRTDWQHLLDPYRRHLHAVVGDKLLYDKPNHLPLIAGIVCGAESHRSATNPYAFQPDRRLDSINGVSNYHARLAPHMRAMPAQGLIVWGQGGFNPRGAMYRPDFDILPPEVTPNLARFAGLFKEQGMRFGVAARPGQYVTPLNATTDTVGWIDPKRPDELELLTKRFRNMVALGATLFYLDSFGNRLDDVAIMRAVRAGIGPGVQTFVEHPSDVIIPYSGLLPVLVGDMKAGTQTIAFAGAFWLNPPETPTIPVVMRYFYPDVPIVCLIQVQGVDTEERKRSAIEFCLGQRMTPMIIDDWLSPQTMEWLAPLVARYLTPEGSWR
jgi:hypothetical protein